MTAWYSTILAPEDAVPQGTGTVPKPEAPDRRKPGPPRLQLSVEEQQQATTLTAAGWSQNRVAKTIGRSRNVVKHHLDKPEVLAEVREERASLVEIYRDRARACVVAIDDEKIAKSSALQLATSSGILLDKSLLLEGQATSIDVTVMLDVAEAIRAMGDTMPTPVPEPNQP